jgi:hypothetical protein
MRRWVVWWGEAPERPGDSTEATDDDRFDGNVTPKNAPSRDPALGQGSARLSS